MKFILSIFVILSCWTISAQGLNAELGFNDNYSQTSKGIVTVGKYSYTIHKQFNNTSYFTTSILTKIDTLGAVIWEREIDPVLAELIDVYEIVVDENQNIYVLGKATPTCDVGSNCLWFIQKYQSDGSQDWKQTWPDNNCTEIQLSGMSLSLTNHLFVNHSLPYESKIFSFNYEYQYSESPIINQTHLEGITELEAYSLERYAYKEYTLFKYDDEGYLANSISLNSPIKGIKGLNDTLYVLTENKLYLFHSSLLEIGSLAVPGKSNYSTLKVKNATIEFISRENTETSVLTLNHQLDVLNTQAFPLVLESEDFVDFNDQHLATTHNFSLTKLNAIRYLDYSRKSTENATVNTTDIGIIDMQVTKTTAAAHPVSPNVYQIGIYVDVLVKNFGNNTLNDCRISHQIEQSVGCGYRFYTEHFSNLNLAPTESTWITLGLVHSEENYFPNEEISRNICVYTSHPNYKTDLNVQNDELCKNVLIGYVNVEELESNGISIYPNPTNSILNIDSKTENLNFSIYNLQGVEVQKGIAVSNQLDVSSLANGMYVLVLSSEDGLRNQQTQFIKE